MGVIGWSEFWEPEPHSNDWCHTGICVLASGELVFGSPRSGELVVVAIDAAGTAARLVSTSFTELHGITSDGDGVWIADPAVKPAPDRGYEWMPSIGRAARIDLDGTVTAELLDPMSAGITTEPWRPTSIAVVDQGPLERAVWVADGYGTSRVHLFSPEGELLRTIDGSESGTPFSCPHGLVITTVGERELLLVADRGNRRIARFSVDGDLVDVITDDQMRSPSCFAARAGRVVLTELDGALLELHADATVTTIVDRAHRVEDEKGLPTRDGWPNMIVDGRLSRPVLEPNVLNSPHGVAIGRDDEIYLTEWVIGGRFLVIRDGLSH